MDNRKENIRTHIWGNNEAILVLLSAYIRANDTAALMLFSLNRINKLFLNEIYEKHGGWKTYGMQICNRGEME